MRCIIHPCYAILKYYWCCYFKLPWATDGNDRIAGKLLTIVSCVTTRQVALVHSSYLEAINTLRLGSFIGVCCELIFLILLQAHSSIHLFWVCGGLVSATNLSWLRGGNRKSMSEKACHSWSLHQGDQWCKGLGNGGVSAVSLTVSLCCSFFSNLCSAPVCALCRLQEISALPQYCCYCASSDPLVFPLTFLASRFVFFPPLVFSAPFC